MTDPNPASILAEALRWKDEGSAVALATITATWPTAPLRAGSQMAVARGGARCGSLFGPAIDAEVAQAAQAMLAAGTDRWLQLVVDDATASAAGLACGGAMEIRLEAIGDGPGGQSAILRETLAAIRERRSCVLCTWLGDGRRELLPAAGSGIDPPWAVEALRRARLDDSGIAPVQGAEMLFQVFNAPLRLYVVGAVRIAAALIDAARLLGFATTLVDPRPERMSALPFAGARTVVADAGTALREAGLDARCAVVLLSHAPEIDDPGLLQALGSEAFYIGALGSRRTHAARLARLDAMGVAPASAARIRGPAGLAIGAVGPAEIAASIVAEIVAVLRQGAAAARPG